MKTLPLQIRKNGFNYAQVLREGRKAIYAQSVTSELQYFEVFTIRTRQASILKGKLIQSSEMFPGNEDFGKTAWSFRTLAKAQEKFKSLPI